MKLPKKYQGFGLHLWCNKEKKVVTKAPCKHTERLVFQSRIYNPTTKRQDIIRSWATRSDIEAWELHTQFKKELEAANFQLTTPDKKEAKPQFFLKECILRYFDYLQDIDVPSYEQKNLSTDYIKDQKRYITRFAECMKSIESRLSSFHVSNITDQHVGAWHTYVENLKLSKDSYNHHINSVKYFVKYLQTLPGADFDNPFIHIKKKRVYRKKEIITEAEFRTLLEKVTSKNGKTVKGKAEKGVNYYRDWLVDAYKLAILTGERQGALANMKWKHEDGNFLVLPNFKVNNKEKTDIYKSYTYISPDLAELLLKMNPGDPEDYIIAPHMRNRNTVSDLLSNSFTHFWRLTKIEKKVSFNNFRHTYITRLRVYLGKDASKFKHASDETQNKHYVNEKEVMAVLEGVRMYNFD